MFADGQAVVAYVPTILFAELQRLHAGDVEQDAFGQRGRSRHGEIARIDMAAELITGIRHTFCAHIKADHQAILILGFIVKKMRRTGGHQPTMAGADLRALIALADDAMAIDVDRDFVAL